MWVLGVSLEDRHSMVMMLQKQRSLQQGPVTAGQTGAVVDAVSLERRKRKPQSPSLRRSRRSLGDWILEHLYLL